jgi:membrane protein implicated in regulation of membrane protease activity
MQKNDRNSAIAAAIILVAAGLGFFVMPGIMLSLSEISPWLSYAVAIVFVLAFFAVFWLRARHQRRRDGER